MQVSNQQGWSAALSLSVIGPKGGRSAGAAVLVRRHAPMTASTLASRHAAHEGRILKAYVQLCEYGDLAVYSVYGEVGPLGSNRERMR